MASGKTSNYQLNQWVTADQVLMADFNADNQKIDTALTGKAGIVTGSYKGAGTYGENNPNTLDFQDTLGKAPKLIIITSTAPVGTIVFVHGAPEAVRPASSVSSQDTCHLTWTATGVSWYAGLSAPQMNSTSYTYYYAAIG